MVDGVTMVGSSEETVVEVVGAGGLLRKPYIAVTQTEVLNLKARLSATLIEKWGMVAGIPDGEDSAGRSKLRLLTPQEVVDRATETADIVVDAFRTLGWVAASPSLGAAVEMVAKAEAEKAAVVDPSDPGL